MLESLKIEDVKAGSGKEVKKGSLITVHYTGWVYDSTQGDNKGFQFDSSTKRNQPFQFPLGIGMVIQGWEEGFLGMREGGKRILTIPPHMAYGEQGIPGVIPPNATLLFEISLLKTESES
ncbi:MAG: FKBP-type peptidyl-prolyl cis-trans isomerase [Chlamydiales bacterium]